MTIDNLKDLKALIGLMRSTGVTTIKVDGIELELGSQPLKKAKMVPSTSFMEPSADELLRVPKPFIQQPTNDRIETEELTLEQQLFMSSDPSVMNS